MKNLLILFILFIPFLSFTQTKVKPNSKGEITLPKKIDYKYTGYMITNDDNTKDSLFVSAKGKYFVFRIAKESGNKYKKYLKIEIEK